MEQVWQGAGIVLRVGCDFRDRDVAGGADEVAELPVGDRRAVDPESIDGDAVDRRLLGIVPVRAHPERATGNPGHSIVFRRLVDRGVRRPYEQVCIRHESCPCKQGHCRRGVSADTAEVFSIDTHHPMPVDEGVLDPLRQMLDRLRHRLLDAAPGWHACRFPCQ